MWDVSEQTDIHILTPQQRLDDSESIEQAFNDLHQRVSVNPAARWIINAAGISRISSLAIAQLIATVRAVDMTGGKIVMAAVHPFVANVLRTTRIVRVLPLFDDIDSAREHLV